MKPKIVREIFYWRFLNCFTEISWTSKNNRIQNRVLIFADNFQFFDLFFVPLKSFNKIVVAVAADKNNPFAHSKNSRIRNRLAQISNKRPKFIFEKINTFVVNSARNPARIPTSKNEHAFWNCNCRCYCNITEKKCSNYQFHSYKNLTLENRKFLSILQFLKAQLFVWLLVQANRQHQAPPFGFYTRQEFQSNERDWCLESCWLSLFRRILRSFYTDSWKSKDKLKFGDIKEEKLQTSIHKR